MLLTRCGLPPPASGRLPLQGEDLVACVPPAFAPKGAILKSHGETIAGLTKLLKDGPAGRRGAAGRRPVSADQPGQTGTLQPPRDLKMSGSRDASACWQ